MRFLQSLTCLTLLQVSAITQDRYEASLRHNQKLCKRVPNPRPQISAECLKTWCVHIVEMKYKLRQSINARQLDAQVILPQAQREFYSPAPSNHLARSRQPMFNTGALIAKYIWALTIDICKWSDTKIHSQKIKNIFRTEEFEFSFDSKVQLVILSPFSNSP